MLTDREVLSTLNMLRNEHLDVRTVTLGISLFDCASHDFDVFAYRVRAKIAKYAGQTRRHLQRSGRQVRHPRRQQAHQRQPHRGGGRVLLPRSDGAGLPGARRIRQGRGRRLPRRLRRAGGKRHHARRAQSYRCPAGSPRHHGPHLLLHQRGLDALRASIWMPWPCSASASLMSPEATPRP